VECDDPGAGLHPTTTGKIAVADPDACNSWLSGVYADADRRDAAVP